MIVTDPEPTLCELTTAAPFGAELPVNVQVSIITLVKIPVLD